MCGDKKGILARFQGDFQKVFRVKPQNGPSIRSNIADPVETPVEPVDRIHVGHEDQMMELSSPAVFLVNAADFSCQEEAGRPRTGRGDL